MKKSLGILLFLVSLNLQSNEVVTSFEQAEVLTEEGRLFPNTTEDMLILENEANSLGVMIGQYDASLQINEYLSLNERKLGLDKFGSFEMLGIAKKYKGVWLVNPSIKQFEQQYLISPDKKSFTVKDKHFAVDKEPYFTKTKPSWRDYLLQEISPPTLSNASVLPRNKQEQVIWKKALRSGYNYGFDSQQESALYQIAHFADMIVGMNLYDVLKSRKIVSDFIITDDFYPISGGGFELDINLSNVRITVNPSLESNAWDWEEVPELRDVSDLLPMRLNKRDWSH